LPPRFPKPSLTAVRFCPKDLEENSFLSHHWADSESRTGIIKATPRSIGENESPVIF
jgi:hypothetical protein